MQKNIRVVMAYLSYPPTYSGASKQAHQINRRLLTRGIEILVLTKREADESDIIDGVGVLRFPKKGLGQKVYSRWGLLLWTLQTSLFLILKRKKYDLIHVLESYYYASIFAVLGMVLKKPVLVKNAVGRGAIRDTRPHQRLRLNLLKKYAIMIAISGETYRELLEHGFSQKRVVFIPNGVDTELFMPRQKESGDGIFFNAIYVGLLNRLKGTDVLLKVWQRFIQEHPAARLLLVGPAKEEGFLYWLQKYIEENHLSEHVSLEGLRNNVKEYLQAADVFLFPSEREGLPNALLEAMASGLPCIARPIGGVEDLIENGKNGFLCPDSGLPLEENLLAALLRVKENPALASAMGAAARETVFKGFSLEKVTEDYRLLYLQVGNQSKKS